MHSLHKIRYYYTLSNVSSADSRDKDLSVFENSTEKPKHLFAEIPHFFKRLQFKKKKKKNLKWNSTSKHFLFFKVYWLQEPM